MGKERTSEGKCIYCDKFFEQSQMAKHLAAHLAALEKEAAVKTATTYCHVAVAAGEMFLHLLVKGTAKMKVIDGFLRDIWLDCCGHLSAFRHNRTNIGIGMLVQDVCAPRTKLQHHYDFGTTTVVELVAHKQYQLALNENIILLSRNEPLKLMCAPCKKKPATTLCTVCNWDNYAFFCDACGEKHGATCDDFADYAAMPVVNSPRMGECGYEGGMIDKERDGCYKM
jgi:hypothetical protein